VQEVLDRCESENIPFKLFEGYRSPQRQKYLYNTVRTSSSGKKYRVTKAKAWRSYHQYGVAADFVLHINGKWSWNTSGSAGRMWERLHEIGEECGLEPLSFEKPHMQLKGASIRSLMRGEYPPGGDQSWADNIAKAREDIPAGAPPKDPVWGEPRSPFAPDIWDFDDLDILAERPIFEV
jgi:peptidoglycan L-alanyl-D-glutamate endopeptidase CwlK